MYKEMVLLPKFQYESLLQQNGQLLTPEPSLETEKQLESIRDKRFLKQVRTSTMKQPEENPVPKEPVWKDTLFLTVNQKWHQRLHALLNFITTKCKSLSIDDSSYEVLVNGNALYNSNIVDLLHFAVRDTYSKQLSPPNALDEFVNCLRDHSIPLAIVGLNIRNLLVPKESTTPTTPKEIKKQSPSKPKRFKKELGLGDIRWVKWSK